MRAISRGLAAITVSIAALTLPSAPASADTTASDVGDTLAVRSDSEGDDIRLTGDSTTLTVTDDDGFSKTFFRADFTAIDIDAGGGADKVFILVGAATTSVERTAVSGGGDNDTLTGGSGPETFNGNDGDDTVRAGGGDDSISGGLGADTIEPGTGNNPVDAGPGDDRISYSVPGGSGRIDGGPDFDSLTLFGTGGNDTLRIGDAIEGLLVEHSGSPGYVLGAVGVDKVAWHAGSGDDTLDTNVATGPQYFVDAAGGFDTIEGSDGPDEVRGGIGNDTIHGRGGDDELHGNSDDDTIDGGEGADRVTGGEGVDAFTCDGLDAIADFEPGESETGCFPVDDPPPAKEPDPVAPIDPGTGAPSAPNAPVDPVAPAPAPVGFTRPRIVAARTGLKVVLRNTQAQPVRLAFTATERRGGKLHRYRRVRRTIPAGRRVAIELQAPRALLRQLAGRRGKRRAAVTVTNVATGAKVTARR